MTREPTRNPAAPGDVPSNKMPDEPTDGRGMRGRPDAIARACESDPAFASLVDDLRAAYAAGPPPRRSAGLSAFMAAPVVGTLDVAPAVGPGGDVEAARAADGHTARVGRRLARAAGAFVATVTGKVVLGGAIAAAGVGGLHAADVVDVPVLPDNDPPATTTIPDVEPAVDSSGAGSSGGDPAPATDTGETGDDGSGAGEAGDGGTERGSSADAPGRTGNTPGQSGTTPGQSGETPGQSGTTPGQSGETPGQSGETPGQSGNTPGQSGNTPGQSGNPPGQSGNPPGQSGNTPGQSGETPGQSGNTPGQSGNPPGQSGDGPGRSGEAPGHGPETGGGDDGESGEDDEDDD